MNAEVPTDLILLTDAAAAMKPTRGRKVHTGTFWRWIKAGELRAWRIRGRVHVSRGELELRSVPVPIQPAVRPARRATARAIAASRRRTEAVLRQHGLLPQEAT